MRNRRALSAFLTFATCLGTAKADVIPRLRASWKEKEARVTVFSADGRLLVSSGDDRHSLRDSATGEVRAVLATRPHQLHAPRFSPDGRFLLAKVTSDRHDPLWVYDLKIWDAATGREFASFPYISDSMNASTDHFALSGDGRTLAFLDNSERLPVQLKTGWMSIDRLPKMTTYHNDNPGLERVKLWDVATWKEVATLEGGSHLVFSPDGKTLVTGSRTWKDPAAKVWDATSGKLRAEFTIGGPWVKPMVFSPDGKSLAIGSSKDLVLYEIEGGRQWPVPAQGRRADGPAFSQDGKLLFPNGMPHVDPLIRTGGTSTCYDLSRLPPTRLELGSGELAISPDGRRYAVFGGGKSRREPAVVTLHELPSMRETGRFVEERLEGAGFSPDGRRLATLVGRHEARFPGPGSRDLLEIRLLDPATGRVLATIPSPGETWGNYGFKFSPDGNTLAIRYRTGSNMHRAGDPDDPSTRPMTLELWDLTGD